MLRFNSFASMAAYTTRPQAANDNRPGSSLKRWTLQQLFRGKNKA